MRAVPVIPEQWPHLSARAAGARHRLSGLPGERQWLLESQPVQHREMRRWPRNLEDQERKPKSCDRLPRSPRQTIGSWQGHSGLLGNTFEGAWREIVAGLSSNCNAPRPLGMFELPVAPPCGHQHPARKLQLLDHLADLHTTSAAGLEGQCCPLWLRLASVRSRNSEKEAQP